MTEKNSSSKSQTKAGMLGKKGSQTADEDNKAAAEKDTEHTPKISKKEAEGHHDDKPIH